MARFFNYEQDKAFWFSIYLQLAAAICEHPYLSAKNSDFKEYIKGFPFPGDIKAENTRRTYGTK